MGIDCKADHLIQGRNIYIYGSGSGWAMCLRVFARGRRPLELEKPARLGSAFRKVNFSATSITLTNFYSTITNGFNEDVKEIIADVENNLLTRSPD